MARASVRYFVDDVDEAIRFYERLGFEVEMHPVPAFAMLGRDGLRLILNAPGAGGPANRSPTVPCPSRAVGTGSSSRSRTWTCSSSRSGTPAWPSAVGSTR